MTTKQKFNIQLLNNCIIKDNALLIGEYNKLNRDTIINYKCNCGIESTKNFRCLVYYGGAYCKICCDKNAREKLSKSNIEKYGVEHAMQHPDIKNKIKRTFIEKYGVEHPVKTKEVRDKMTNTMINRYDVPNALQNKEINQKLKDKNIDKYGVENVFQLESIKEKIKETNITKYGVENVSQNEEIKGKIKETFIKKYGVIHPAKTDEFKEKVKKTNILKYGVENITQVPEIHEKIQKSSFRLKEYKMPSGEIRNIQGFEHYALDELVKIYSEEQIITNCKNIPRFEYEYQNKKKYYYPDIYIPHENKIIEVKSDYTIKCNPEMIKLKGQSCKQKGYNYEIWVYDNLKNKECIIY